MRNFKAYLTIIEESKKEKEIRRFSVDYDVSTNFFYLREKLQCVFPILHGKQFSITWEDVEGDFISISSDEELRIALQESSDCSYQKLFITLQSDEHKNVWFQPEEVGIIHNNVICDACNKNVKGFRYKCIECPDYDLCCGCEGRGLHPEHYMLRIAEPVQGSSRYVKRLAHHMKKFIRNSLAHTRREETLGECPIMKERYRRRHATRLDSTPMMGTFVDFFDSPSYAEEYPMKFDDPNPPETATEATASCNKPQSQKMETEENKPINLFKVVEDTIAPVLNQLGINISMKVTDDQQSGSNPNNGPTNQTDTKGASNINEKSDSKPYNAPTNQTDTKGVSNVNEKSDSKPCNAPTNQTDIKGVSNINEKSDSKPYNASTNQADSKEAPIINDKPGKSSNDDEWTIVNKEGKSVDANVSDIAKILLISSNSLECTNENEPQEMVTPSAPKNEPSNGNLYPPLPQPSVAQPILYHPNPQIQSAIISMLEMGFSNEGGWLTQLLVAENGNINKILDKLSPVKM